jgi:NADH dehydrogenase (ubiquinone) 1 alpha subcomplex subunit 5
VNPGAREQLAQLYNDTLAALERLPEEAEYRRAVEKTTRHRLQIVRDEPDTGAIERKIDCGQIEELVTQAEDELSLIPKMEQWKPWEALAQPPPASQW